MHLQKLVPVLIFLFALFVSSCRSQKVTTEKEHQETTIQADSTSVVVEKITEVITTPQTTAKLNLTQKQIEELPIGAVYEAKDGNATGTVRKTADNNIEFTANCDSLTILIESLTKEVYRLNKEKTELKNSLKEEKIVEVNKLNGWQHFQIYGFRIYIILTLIYIGYRKWKK